jgi:hypothetical protein
MLVGAIVCSTGMASEAGHPAARYFAYPAVEDRYGVIAPWYQGQDGQCDFRIRVAAETLKRYPWAAPPMAVTPAPHFVFNGDWSIKPDGTILVDPKLPDWHNGDLGQRSASLLTGLTNYYRYTGDPAAIALVTVTADYLVDHCQTPDDHPWPRFLVSCPTKGKAYADADPHGFIQLDVAAQVGSGMLAAYQLTGNRRYFEAARHWGDLLALHCDRRPGSLPWNRYANPEDAKWDDTRQTGGVSLILQFLDDLIRLGYRGQRDALVQARDAGDKYLRDVLLPEWSRDPTWGHHFWDWVNTVMTCSVPCYTAQYLMNRREAFPAWKTDLRNVLSLFFCRSSVNPDSGGGVYSGAWAFPESSGCCRDSLQYPTMIFAATLTRYGILADDAWAREVARRQSILVTYDARETGVVEDGISGHPVVAGNWFNLAHPWPLRCLLDLVAWQPDLWGPARENHIVRSTAVVRDVTYGKGRIAYSIRHAPAPCEDVLRLAFVPTSVIADGKPLEAREALSANGYRVWPLAEGDCLLTIRHDDLRRVVVEGDDPQQEVEDNSLAYEGAWSAEPSAHASGGGLHTASQAGAAMSFVFEGNQVRLIGSAAPDGGRAEVYLDEGKQLAGIDFWCPQVRHQQVLYYRNGLGQGKHSLRIVVSGAKNPLSRGTRAFVDAVQWSDARGHASLGEGAGPDGAQRVIFGYVGRKDYVDSQGHAWRPATEFIMRKGRQADLVPLCFWTEPQIDQIEGTADPELYRYGVHGRDFTAYFTVNPQRIYHVRIKLCQADRSATPGEFATSIDLQGKPVAGDLDIAARAGGPGKALDLVFNNVRAEHGVIAILFFSRSGEAMVQAVELGPAQAGAEPRPE